jgi:hypothetical protein
MLGVMQGETIAILPQTPLGLRGEAGLNHLFELVNDCVYRIQAFLCPT